MKQILFVLLAAMSLIACNTTKHTIKVDDKDALRPPGGYKNEARSEKYDSIVRVLDAQKLLAEGKPVQCPTVSNVKQTDSTANTVSFTFSVSSSASKYYIYKKIPNTVDNYQYDGTTTSTSYTMVGLLPATSYQIKIAPVVRNKTCPLAGPFSVSTSSGVIPPTPGTTPNLVLIQFEVDTVQGTTWNSSSWPVIYTHGSGLDDSSKLWVTNWVKNYYTGHPKLSFTLDKAYFKANADPNYSLICYVSQNDSFYCGGTPCAGGVSMVGSFNTGGVNWVFSKALGFNNRNIGQATGHEIGHALGLHHAIDTCGQSYASSRILCSDGIYRTKIMGSGYSDYQHFFQRPSYITLWGIPILEASTCISPDEDATIESHIKQ